MQGNACCVCGGATPNFGNKLAEKAALRGEMISNDCIQDVSFSDCESSHVGKLYLQLNCNSDCIHVLRSIVAVMTARAGMGELQSNRVAIAVDELFANIATHAYLGKPGKVEFVTRIEDRQHGGQELVFSFRDYASIGWSGDPAEEASRRMAIEELCPGGLGLQLICAVADRCDHHILEDGNQWQLTFNIDHGKQLKGEAHHEYRS